VGETLRRVRKERGKTLGQLAQEARVGKGQLSRIETGKQEITLATLAKVLDAHGLSRREFFRRYDLVEAEAGALGGKPEVESPAASFWGDEAKAAISRIAASLDGLEHAAIAQGGLEIGPYVVMFRVVPRTKAEPKREPRLDADE
jgi:transcriptional regulator with XRE-family HTH domain